METMAKLHGGAASKNSDDRTSGAGKNASRKSPPKFDLDNPKLPDEIAERALASGGYPYEKKLKRDEFEKELSALQIELVKLQQHALRTKERIIVLFEGRDAAGKGTCIGRFREHLNPRHARVVALPKPTETEIGQWYFQRYIVHFPTFGEIVFFDRSWYNRAGVERVMGFCTEKQVERFLHEAPILEGMIVRDGIRFFKIFLEIGREMQMERFHERRHDPMKQWKVSDIDIAAISHWDDYTRAKEDMLRATDSDSAPWTVVLANDQRRARLETIRLVLSQLNYRDKNEKAVGAPDPKLVGRGGKFFETAE
jgi:polyphosphate kinase 2